MDWNQIESKWAAMTRRVRLDWSADRIDPKVVPGRRAARPEVKPELIADRQAGVVDRRQKLSNE